MRRLRVIGIALLVCIGLAGCGSGDEGFTNRIQPGIAPDGTKTLRIGNGAEPQTLDPHQASGVPSHEVLNDLYEGLVITDRDGHLIPGVAKSWDISDDRKTYTFHLRRDAKWSNGKPLTAHQYVFSLRRAVDPKTASPYADIHSPIVNASAVIDGKKPAKALGVKALDRHTLQIKLNKPTPYFLKTLVHPSSDPVYPPAVKKWGDSFTQPGHAVTNGAYEMVSWRVNDKIVVKKNPYYHGADKVKIDRVEYYPITDTNSELKRYQAGGLDWTYTAPPSQYDSLHKYIPKQDHAIPTIGVWYIGFNVTRPPFKGNRKLRLALSMALDRKVIAEKIMRGGEPPAYSWIPTFIDNYQGASYPWANWSDEKREARARKLYQEAGYSKDHPLKADYLYMTGEKGRKIAIVATAMWRKVLGAEIIPRHEEWKVYLQDTRRKIDTQIFFAGWIGDYADPNTFFSILNSHAALNYTGYHSAKYDRLQSESEHTPDGPKRQRMMRGAEATLLHDAPIAPLFFQTTNHIVKPYVKGFRGNLLDNYYRKDMDIVPANNSVETSRSPASHKGGS